MSLTSLRSARLILANPMDAGIPRKIATRKPIMVAITSPELTAVVAFCVLGVLVMLAINLLVPNFGETAASIQPLL